jgi:uncharacterized protein YcfL
MRYTLFILAIFLLIGCWTQKQLCIEHKLKAKKIDNNHNVNCDTVTSKKNSSTEVDQINQADAIKIANEEASRLDYNIYDKKTTVGKEAITWDSLIVQYKYFRLPSLSKYKAKLENKKFWSVYYEPKQITDMDIIFGGDLWIFIDAKNGEIICTIKGK